MGLAEKNEAADPMGREAVALEEAALERYRAAADTDRIEL